MGLSLSPSLQPIPPCAAAGAWDSVSVSNCNLFPHVQQTAHGSVSVSLCNLFPHVRQPVHGTLCLSLQPVSSCAAASAWDSLSLSATCFLMCGSQCMGLFVSLCNLFPHVRQPVHGTLCLSLQPVSSCAAASAWDSLSLSATCFLMCSSQCMGVSLSLSATCFPMCGSQCMGLSLSLIAAYSHMCSRLIVLHSISVLVR